MADKDVKTQTFSIIECVTSRLKKWLIRMSTPPSASVYPPPLTSARGQPRRLTTGRGFGVGVGQCRLTSRGDLRWAWAYDCQALVTDVMSVTQKAKTHADALSSASGRVAPLAGCLYAYPNPHG